MTIPSIIALGMAVIAFLLSFVGLISHSLISHTLIKPKPSVSYVNSDYTPHISDGFESRMFFERSEEEIKELEKEGYKHTFSAYDRNGEFQYGIATKKLDDSLSNKDQQV